MLHSLFLVDCCCTLTTIFLCLGVPRCPQLSPLHAAVPAAFTCLQSLHYNSIVLSVGMEQEGHSLLPSTGL